MGPITLHTQLGKVDTSMGSVLVGGESVSDLPFQGPTLRQRQVWLIPVVDERVDVQVKL